MKSIMIIWLLIFPSPKLTFLPLKIGGKGRLDPASFWGFGPIWLLLGTVFYPRNSKMSSWPNDVTLPHEKIWSGTRTPNEQGGKPLGGWKWSPIFEDEDEEAVSLINPLWIHITWWCCYLTFIARKWKSSPKNVRSIYTRLPVPWILRGSRWTSRFEKKIHTISAPSRSHDKNIILELGWTGTC